jgi:hypothetical protein
MGQWELAFDQRQAKLYVWFLGTLKEEGVTLGGGYLLTL